MVLSHKSLDCAHVIDRKVVLKKKKRTRKDTENVRWLILWDSLWIYIRSKILMSRFRSQDFLSCWVMIYDRKSPEKKIANIYSFTMPDVKLFTATLRFLRYKRRFSFKFQRIEARTFWHMICFAVCRLEMIITTAESTWMFKTQRSLIVLQKFSLKKLFTLKIIRLVLYIINFEAQDHKPFNYRLMLEVR